MGVIFIFAGLVAVLSAVVLTTNPAAALPWVLVSWPLTVLAGYRVWRAANPTTSVRSELARRSRAVVSFIVVVSIAIVAATFPQLIAIVVGLWVVVIAVLFLALAWPGRNGSG